MQWISLCQNWHLLHAKNFFPEAVSVSKRRKKKKSIDHMGVSGSSPTLFILTFHTYICQDGEKRNSEGKHKLMGGREDHRKLEATWGQKSLAKTTTTYSAGASTQVRCLREYDKFTVPFLSVITYQKLVDCGSKMTSFPTLSMRTLARKQTSRGYNIFRYVGELITAFNNHNNHNIMRNNISISI